MGLLPGIKISFLFSLLFFVGIFLQDSFVECMIVLLLCIDIRYEL